MSDAAQYGGLVIAFDLDGTLSDPAAGICGSINHVLEGFGQPAVAAERVREFIGVSLEETFGRLLEGSGEEGRIGAAVDRYREHYRRRGYRESRLYPGVSELLGRLAAATPGVGLYVSTLKAQDIAVQVAAHLGIEGQFRGVLGCGSDRRKAELLGEIRRRESARGGFMVVGDRHEDMRAGAEAGFTRVGALWGYGSRRELLDAGAEALIESPLELLQLPRVELNIPPQVG